MSWNLVQSDDDYSIALHRLGGTGPTLLIVHAASLCASMYVPLAEALGENYSIVAPDLRGHGRSRGEVRDHSWTRLSQDIVETIDNLPGPAFAFGHSLGATALLLAAAQRPDRLEAIVAYEPVVLTNSKAAAIAEAQATRAERRYASFESIEDARARLSSRPPLDRFDPLALDGYLTDGFVHHDDDSVELALAPQDEAALYRAAIGIDFDADFSRVSCAVTLVTGDESENALILGVGHLSAVLQKSSVETLSGSGHFGPLEAPHATAALISRAFATPAA